MGDERMIAARDLARFMEDALAAAGVPRSDAAVVADNLVQADLQGIGSHGVGRFPVYFGRVSAGLVNPRPAIRIDRRFPAVLHIDGDNGLGAAVTRQSLDALLEVAGQFGVAAAGIRNSNHFGTAGYYCHLAAERGYVTLIYTNGPPATPAWGAREAYFGTNPLAFGLPRRERPHIIADLATSVAARGKIIAAAKAGRDIPAGWALDQEGHPTTDARAALAGVLLPIAGPKGYALALAVEHLAGVLTGAGFGRDVAWQYGDKDVPANVGHCLIALHPGAFGSMEEYYSRMERFCDEIRSLARMPDCAAVKLPGEPEWDRAQAAGGKIAVGDTLAAELAAIADQLGIPGPEASGS